MASKGKKEKTKSPPPPIEAESPIEKDVVPGKLSERAWLDLLNHAESTEIASEFVHEICEVAFSIIYSHYLEEQAFPHTISDAKHSLLQIIEWQFLARDEGEKNTITDPSWIEDEEPVPAPIDSWARGVVPSHSLSSLDTPIEVLNPIRVQTPPPAISEDSEVSKDTPGLEFKESTASSRRAIASTGPAVKKQLRTRPVARHTKARLVPIPPPTQNNDTGAERDMEYSSARSYCCTLTPSQPVSSLHSHTLTSQTGGGLLRPLPYGMKPIQLSWQKEVSYDSKGNIVDMLRLDPTKFPRHCVKPVVTLVKPLTHQHPKKPMGVRQPHNHEREVGPCQRGRGVSRKRNQDLRTGESRRFPELPTLPSLVDTIDPVAGVTVREAGRTVHGAQSHKTLSTHAPHSALAPIQSQCVDTSNRTIDVK